MTHTLLSTVPLNLDDLSENLRTLLGLLSDGSGRPVLRILRITGLSCLATEDWRADGDECSLEVWIDESVFLADQSREGVEELISLVTPEIAEAIERAELPSPTDPLTEQHQMDTGTRNAVALDRRVLLVGRTTLRIRDLDRGDRLDPHDTIAVHVVEMGAAGFSADPNNDGWIVFEGDGACYGVSYLIEEIAFDLIGIPPVDGREGLPLPDLGLPQTPVDGIVDAVLSEIR